MRCSTTAPVKIVMLGAGGTGGHIAPLLYRLLYTLDRPSRFVICDGDIVEEKNLIRQNFSPADLGENKAKVLAERYASVFGMEAAYVPSFVEDLDTLMKLITPRGWELEEHSCRRTMEMVLLLGAVDNNRSRQLCHEAFYQSDNLIYIDSGNGEFSGQVACGRGVPGDAESRRQIPHRAVLRRGCPGRPPEHSGQYHGGNSGGEHGL